MAKKIITIGIMPYARIKARTIAIARGTIKPAKGDPKVWFPSVKSFASVLSEKNRALLAVIRTANPESLAELEKATGRAQSNLSRTLRTMEKYGIVRLIEGRRRRGRAPIKPIVVADEIRLDMAIA